MFDRLKQIAFLAAAATLGVVLWAGPVGGAATASAQTCGVGGCGQTTTTPSNCDACTPPPTDCNTCNNGRRFGGRFGGGGGGGTGGSGSGGSGGAGGSVNGSFSSDVVTTVVNSVVTSVSGSGAGSGGSAGSGSFTGSLFSNSPAFGLSGAINGSLGYGGGGSSFYVDSQTGYIPNLEVYDESAQSSYQATRTAFRTVAIQAFCLDDKAVPHPASQLSPERDVAEAFEGELYRCIAGTRMQYTLAAYEGQASFDKGQTIVCSKGDALYHAKGGQIACRPQKASRDCNERSLLRRFGAGIKILKMAYTETYTATQASASASSIVGSMILDGGVGGVVH